MKGQEHNKGELKELKVQIEKWVVEELQLMANNTKILVRLDQAMKRFTSRVVSIRS